MSKEIVYERSITFMDSIGYKAKIDCEIRRTNKGLEFSACGDYNGSGGQCLAHIKSSNNKQKELIDLWHKYHLNGMHALKHYDGNEEEACVNGMWFYSYRN